MKGTDVKEHAELYLNTTVEDSAVLMLINESLNMIGDLALNDQEVVITTSVGGEWKPLPDDTTNVKAVYSGNDAVDDWYVRGMRIRFQRPGTYQVVIRQMIPEIESLSDEIQVHPLFKMAILSYVRGMLKMIDDDQSADGQALLAQFKEESIKAFNLLERIRNRGI